MTYSEYIPYLGTFFFSRYSTPVAVWPWPVINLSILIMYSMNICACASPLRSSSDHCWKWPYVEAGGRGRGGSIGELRACDSGGAGSGCETADALATAGDADDDATSQLTQAMRQQTADGAEPEPMAAAETAAARPAYSRRTGPRYDPPFAGRPLPASGAS